MYEIERKQVTVGVLIDLYASLCMPWTTTVFEVAERSSAARAIIAWLVSYAAVILNCKGPEQPIEYALMTWRAFWRGAKNV